MVDVTAGRGLRESRLRYVQNASWCVYPLPAVREVSNKSCERPIKNPMLSHRVRTSGLGNRSDCSRGDRIRTCGILLPKQVVSVSDPLCHNGFEFSGNPFATRVLTKVATFFLPGWRCFGTACQETAPKMRRTIRNVVILRTSDV